MSYGLGWGASFGLGGITPTSAPVARVAGPPVSFEFTDEPDGPLPGAWEGLVLSDDGAGAKSGSPDPAPSVAFRVLNGRAGWLYRRVPTVPAPLAPFDEYGVVASPSSILDGRNAYVAAVFDSPTRKVRPGWADSFVFEVLLGLRAADDCASFVGGRVRAEWAAGIWTTPLAVEAVQATGQAPVVIGAAPLPAYNEAVDQWDAAPLHELDVVLRGEVLTVTFGGILVARATVPNARGSKPVVLMRAYNQQGATIEPFAALAAVAMRTLRDTEHLGPAPLILGDIDLENPSIPRIHLPLADLVNAGLFKRIGARVFVATQAVDVTVLARTWTFETGDPVRAVEPFEGQALTPVVIDLARIRAERRV